MTSGAASRICSDCRAPACRVTLARHARDWAVGRADITRPSASAIAHAASPRSRIAANGANTTRVDLVTIARELQRQRVSRLSGADDGPRRAWAWPATAAASHVRRGRKTVGAVAGTPDQLIDRRGFSGPRLCNSITRRLGQSAAMRSHGLDMRLSSLALGAPLGMDVDLKSSRALLREARRFRSRVRCQTIPLRLS